jgi:cytochrome c peroxidase
MKLFIPLLLFLLVLAGCRKDPNIGPYIEDEPLDSIVLYLPNLPDNVYDYEAEQFPPHILNDPNLAHLFVAADKNPVTNEGATLGRVLFYDKNLSANNTISCGSCHHQDRAFTDGMTLSPGHQGLLTGRNSMAIINTELNNFLFWDERAESSEEQVLIPIQDAVEMGMSLADLQTKLQGINYYKPLFEAAFGDTTINATRISLALAQFIKSIRSFKSKYDQGAPSNFSNFTVQEETGRQIFFDPDFTCFQCHFSENYGGLTKEVIGLDSIYNDQGIGALNGDQNDNGRFKAVSLRNIELTGPYMHDGRFATLEDVINFYSEEKQQHANLDFRLTSNYVTGGLPLHFNFTDAEKLALIAFLKTLTDWDLVGDVKYADPFL